jgi:hypothetical protein
MMSKKTSFPTTVENRQEWFCVLLAYLQMKTWAMWVAHYPQLPWETFELIWPSLLDQMLTLATEAAVQKLAKEISISVN